VYEDDGISVDYLSGAYAWTTATYSCTTTQLYFFIKITGNFTQLPPSRTYVLRIVNGLPPTMATVNGVAVTYSMWGGANTWRYEGDELTTVIETGVLPINTVVNISVTTNPINQVLMSGLKGAIQHAIWAKANYDEDWTSDCAQTAQVCNSSLTDLASVGEILSIQAGVDYAGFQTSLVNLEPLYKTAANQVLNMAPPPANALIQMYDLFETDSCLCSNKGCFNAQISNYEMMRVEGYQPNSTQKNAIPLYLYWNSTTDDNWATPATPTPPGYQVSSLSGGWCLSYPETGTVPLQLWYNAGADDHLTLATAAGVAWAQVYGYSLLNSTLCYVYPANPTNPSTTTASRWEYSMSLMQNAFN